MGNALLIRPKYPYGKNQIWMPVDLLKVASQMDETGIESDIVDLNMEKIPSYAGDYDHIAIGVIGAPYIPETMEIARNIQREGKIPLLGGPGVEHLTSDEFEFIYGKGSVQIKNDHDLQKALGVNELPSVYETPVLNKIFQMPQKKLKRYMENEFSFFVSQGCIYACRFCAAVRNVPGKIGNVKEKFSETIEEDLSVLAEKAEYLGVKKLRMYLSSLDLFQTPSGIKEVLKIFAEKRKQYGIDMELRGLSRVDSLLNALREEPELYKLIPLSGIKTIGFGIDGTTDYIWQSQRKGQLSLSEADMAFKKCNDLDVVPEALMVMGFNTTGDIRGDDHESLNKNIDYSRKCVQEYGVVLRPHVAKDCYPGTEGWQSEYWKDQKKEVLENPYLFKNLDFVAFASEVTHPDPDFRNQVNDTYRSIIYSSGERCATSPIMPYKKNDKEWNIFADTFNMTNAGFDR